MGRGNRGRDNDKYIRLTGLWPSKSNDKLFTGRLREEELEKLAEKVKDCQDNGTPLVFSIWENDKRSKRDPEFSLQCFEGESEDTPRDRGRGRDRDREEEPEEEPEEEERPRKKGKTDEKPSKKSKKDDW